MTLRLPGRWVWDFWLARDQGLWHVFYLHAPQTPDNPDARHFSARIGHATSPDLNSWEVQGAVLPVGPTGDWDDLATWTGSVIAHPDGGWAMLYTGVSSREQGLVQRIGLALSPDLHTWIKHPENPVIEADDRWYEMLDTEIWFDQAWRDPWVVHDPDTGTFHAFLTARSRDGDPGERGVVGHATSADLARWDVMPPIIAPTGFGHMEIPQVFHLDGRWHLLFSAPGWVQQARAEPRCTGTFHAISDELTGPFHETAPLFCDHRHLVLASQTGTYSDLRRQNPREQVILYGGKVVVTDNGLACLAFGYLDSDGAMVGELTDPMPVKLAADGALSLVESDPD